MKHVSAEILANQTLDALRQSGASKKKLKDYKYCGINSILQYFKAQGISTYSKPVSDDFLAKTRSEYEQGKISRWKWGIVRRSAELLDHYYTNGNVVLAPLPKWEVLHNPLHQAPSPKQLSEDNNLFVLIYRTKQELLKFGYKSKTVGNFIYDGFGAILRYCSERGITRYDKDAIDVFVAEARANYEAHEICRSVYQNMRKVAAMLDEYHETGRLELRRIPDWGLRMPNTHYFKLLEMFCQENEQTGALAVGTIATARSAIRGFLFELEDMGDANFSSVTLGTVSECMSQMAKRYAGGLQAMFCSVRAFLRFLHQRGITSADLTQAMPEFVAPRRVVREGFRTDEIDILLCCIDRDSIVGKRDYAIMMTAIQTGLRAVDIVNLTRCNIDWRSNEIRIVQHKTNRPLSLSLKPETGNAIADYLLHARQESDLPYIFLCANRPYRPLNNRSASGRISRYMRLTGVDGSAIPRRGFHSFRRSFGTGLLESEISLEMLSELLGQTHMDSMKPYLAANEKGLRSCAIGLLPVERAGEVL